ncbi:hypothetical protein [Microbulbifer sp. THAF38]|uniref:hypothetical protein n=1 Tax=Microbulbifer sp. THAF38 TaxID=2587856 RepID=UPI0012681A72|nr:hypothetical protein [Microbulbifer sp. THAF38]QFT57087.1 hypothetical protein FIU95_21280 [Microbulbifer sp. THAF38]
MNEQPQWQPISMLPIIADMINDMLQASLEQLDSMRLAVLRPHVMDNATTFRVIKVYTEQLKFHWVYEEQLSRWTIASSNDQQRKDINRLIEQAKRLREADEEILKLAHTIEPETIDKILATDEVELAGKMIGKDI